MTLVQDDEFPKHTEMSRQASHPSAIEDAWQHPQKGISNIGKERLYDTRSSSSPIPAEENLELQTGNVWWRS
jgi:hypothetical protein